MTESGPPWLGVMRQLEGTRWDHGDGPNETIQGWLQFIGTSFPAMASYCNAAAREDYFAWCGLTVAYCMAKSGIAPVFGSSETTRFLFATAWLNFGTPVVASPEPGDVLVFDFGGGDHHVTLFEKDNGNGTYACRGGNQGHVANVTNFRKSNLMGIRRPNARGTALTLVADSGTLAPGSQGRLVTALQGALAAAGFDPGGIDGEYGPLTSAAVSKFQHARNLPVTGIADLTTLQTLGVAMDTSSQPRPATETEESTTMQSQDLLKTLIDALITKQVGTPPTQSPVAGAQSALDIGQVIQVAIAALAGKPIPLPAASLTVTPGGAVTEIKAEPVLSTIDQIFGGQALAGKKTLIAVIAYVVLQILEATKQIDTGGATSNILTSIIYGFGALGGLAKVDRMTQAISQATGAAKVTTTTITPAT